MHKWKIAAIHAGAWIIWNLLALSWVIITQTPQPVYLVLYNIISLMLVFYGVRWMAAQYWKRIEEKTRMTVSDNGLKLTYPGFRFYIFQWPFLGVIAIVLAYIFISWCAELFFISTGHYTPPLGMPDFYRYTFSRWSVEAFFVCGGNVMAAIEYHFRKQKEKEKILEQGYEELSRQNQIHTQKLKATIEEYRNQVLEYDRLNKQLNQRLGKLPPDNTGDAL